MAKDEKALRYSVNREKASTAKKRYIRLFMKANRRDIVERNNIAFKVAKRVAKQ